MRRVPASALALFLFFISSFSIAHADAAAIIVDEDFSAASIKSIADISMGYDGPDEIREIVSVEGARKFSSTPEQTLNWGIRPDPLWLRVRIEDVRTDITPLVFVLEYPHIDRVDFYLCQQTYKKVSSGYLYRSHGCRPCHEQLRSSPDCARCAG